MRAVGLFQRCSPTLNDQPVGVKGREPLDTLGDRLRTARERAGHTTRTLAATLKSRLGRSITHGTVSNYENDKSAPRADYVAALCRECDTNPMWLLLGEGPEELVKARETGGAADARYLAREVEKTLDRVMGELRDGRDDARGGEENGAGNGGQ